MSTTKGEHPEERKRERKMKKCKSVKVGDIVEFPHTCFAPYRQGWNGWLFKTGIVSRLYTSTKGFLCAELIYDYRGEDVKTRKLASDLFEIDLEWKKRQKYEFGIDNEEIRFLERHGKI